jgi:hypothetical protein
MDLDLDNLGKMVDEALAKETKETLTQWLNERRQINMPEISNRCSNFQQVLVNGDDQVLVRELLKEHVPIEIQIKITQLFNQKFVRW